ncbi:MAG TPA: autotransporter outer membrane beta-barrel domain-containing protein [Saprospiraceae bacterium]|nr:autotransporter outer membrane beta-barrel domain-containing protein [Saprospiraceae bacterium]
MRWSLLIGWMFLMGNIAIAQVGFSGFYSLQNQDYWKVSYDDGTEVRLVDNVAVFGLSYKLKPFEKKRIEFIPEFNYAMKSNASFGEAKAGWGMMSVVLHTDFYPLEFNGDCHCPTFTKQNPFFKKGFFLRVSPGISLVSHQIEENNVLKKEATVKFNLGVGAGLDIGLSPRLTVTPYAVARFYPKLNWTSLDNSLVFAGEIEKMTTNFMQINLGLRVELQIVDNY